MPGFIDGLGAKFLNLTNKLRQLVHADVVNFQILASTIRRSCFGDSGGICLNLSTLVDYALNPLGLYTNSGEASMCRFFVPLIRRPLLAQVVVSRRTKKQGPVRYLIGLYILPLSTGQ